MKKLFLLILICLFSSFCVGQTQLEMNGDANTDFEKADKELNLTYKKILKEYGSDVEFIKNLKISQNLWIKFRDAEMNVKYPEREEGYYGSVQPMCRSYYLAELTKKRTKDLKIWLIGIEEGDVCVGSVKMKQ